MAARPIEWDMIISDEDLVRMYKEISSLAKMEKKLGVCAKTIGNKLRSLGVELNPTGFPKSIRANKVNRLSPVVVEKIQKGKIGIYDLKQAVFYDRFKRLKAGDVKDYDVIRCVK